MHHVRMAGEALVKGKVTEDELDPGQTVTEVAFHGVNLLIGSGLREYPHLLYLADPA